MRSRVLLPLTCVLFAAARLLAPAQSSVPYVGCPGDGQTGPYAAAKGSPKPVNLTAAAADQLAWYEYKGDAGHFGTLGPRGWNCFVTIGSNGWTLCIAPELLDSAKLLERRNWIKEGTFDGAIGHLQYLCDFGVTHVEVMPVAAWAGQQG